MTPSTSYWINVGRFWRGFLHMDEIRMRPEWERAKVWWTPLGIGWRLVYLLDYGAACVILGIGVQPISRWAGERIQAPWTWLAAILNRLQRGHTDMAGPLLWSTEPCPRLVRYAAVSCWAGAAVLAGWWRWLR